MDRNVRVARWRFDCLWASLFFQICADTCALGFLMYRTPWSTLDLPPFLLLAFVLPQVVLAPYFGSLASLVRPRERLVGASAVSAVCILLLWTTERSPIGFVAVLGAAASVHRAYLPIPCSARVAEDSSCDLANNGRLSGQVSYSDSHPE